MSCLSAKNTTRPLLKLTSIALLGTLAGLFTASSLFPNTRSYPATETTPRSTISTLPESLDARRIPGLHHPPSARRLQYGSLALPSQTAAPNHRPRS
jgi:hypothetical protein